MEQKYINKLTSRLDYNERVSMVTNRGDTFFFSPHSSQPLLFEFLAESMTSILWQTSWISNVTFKTWSFAFVVWIILIWIHWCANSPQQAKQMCVFTAASYNCLIKYPLSFFFTDMAVSRVSSVSLHAQLINVIFLRCCLSAPSLTQKCVHSAVHSRDQI